MIDMLILRCQFREKWSLKLSDLPIPLEASIQPETGDIFNHRHQWESIPSSHDSLAFKVFDYVRENERHFYIEIKASPAKIMQGHNVYGTDDICSCAFALIECLFAKYPTLETQLDTSAWTVHQVDVTYHSFADSEENAIRFIRSLSNVANGQTKARTGFNETCYFGKKNSRLRKIKVYAKHTELQKRIERITRQGDPNKLLIVNNSRLLDYTKGMIRWEVSVMSRWFERHGIRNKLQDFIEDFEPQKAWEDIMKPIMTALDGKQLKIIRDEKVHQILRAKYGKITRSGRLSYALADSVYRTYRTIKAEGYVQAREIMSSTTFNNHINYLRTAVGMSKAHLQQMQGQGLMCEVIPFARFVSVDFGTQFPEWHTEAA